MERFDLVAFTKRLYRRSPPWFISGAICAVLLAASQVIYYSSRGDVLADQVTAVKLAAPKEEIPEELLQPAPEIIDRSAVPENDSEEIVNDLDMPEEYQISDHNETDNNIDEFDEVYSDPLVSDQLPPGVTGGTAIGVGENGHYGLRPSAFSGKPGGGGKYSGRGGNQNLRAVGGSGTEKSMRDGLEWLRHHQSTDGSWDCDGFMSNCGKIGSTVCDGPGEPNHDVGMTGLALLAFMGDGHTTTTGVFKDQVAKGIKWLKDQQDPETGILGERVGHGFMYNHAIGTLALCEAYYATKSPFIRRTTQDAIAFITHARNPYSAWRYEYPPTGENDTSVTGWMVFALKAAEDAGLTIDKQAYAGAASWFDQVTDPATGRTGYDSTGSPSSRIVGLNDRYPPSAGETMTAVALSCRFLMGQDPASVPMLTKQADLVAAKPPTRGPDGLSADFDYWYFGSLAMFRMGSAKYMGTWNQALRPLLLQAQVREGEARGSWNPDDAWGKVGGRVYTTALGALCMEISLAYERLLAGR